MYSWTDHPLKSGLPNKAIYIQELRKVLDEKRKEMGLTSADWSELIKIGEPKKFSHTQQLMLACDDTAKKYGFNSYQDILKREWTPIGVGRPYDHRIVNDLRQVIDGLVWLGFEERFPGTKLDLKKWIVIKEDFPWYVDNALYFFVDWRITNFSDDTQINLLPNIFIFLPEFVLECYMDAWMWMRFSGNFPDTVEKITNVYIRLKLPWGYIIYGYDPFRGNHTMAELYWSSGNVMKFDFYYPTMYAENVKLIVKQGKQSFYMNGNLLSESFGSVDIKAGDLSICTFGELVYKPGYPKDPGVGWPWGVEFGTTIDDIIVRRI